MLLSDGPVLSGKPSQIRGLSRPFLRTHLNPLIVVRAGEKALHTFLTRAKPGGKKDTVESHLVYLACQNTATLYELSSSTEVVNDDFLAALQEEIARELRLMEIAETESEAIAQHLEKMTKAGPAIMKWALYQVPEEIRQERRRRNRAKGNAIKPRRKEREMPAHRINEAAIAPQPVVATAISR